MRSTTSTYKQIIASGETRIFHVRINLTLADETALVLTDSDIMSGTFVMESASSGESSFDIGSAIIGMCKFSLENFDERYTRYDFFNATATVWVKLEGDSEFIRLGFYTVDEPKYNGAIVSLELIDNMWKFDRPLPALSFPITCGEAVNALCLECGVTLATQQFRGYDYTLTVMPEQEMNCREMLQYIAMICCRFCDMDSTGALRLRWYDRESRPEDSLDGGSFYTNTTPYSDGDTADGGNFTNYYSGDDYDGGDFIDSEDVDWFTRNFTVSLGTDEITITGLKFTINEVDYQIGTDGYVLVLENPLVDESNVNSVLNYIWDILDDFRFRTFNISTLPDITAEVGDCCAIKDAKENIVYSYITNIDFNLTRQTVQCNAVTPTRKLSTNYSKTLQIAVEEAKKKTESAISRYDVAVQLMNNLAVNAMGAYQDYEDLETGGRVYYLSNKPITKVDNHCTFVADSTVFKATGDGFFVSTHGGQAGTWQNGYDPTTGTLLVNVLKAIGVSADWVETGLLTDRGHVNYWDLDNNTFVLSATTTVGGKTVNAIAQEKADAAQAAAENTAAQALAAQVAIYDEDIADLQDQIDGNITTWYYSGTPTLNNPPASTWTTTTDKDNHIGDIYYDSATGYAYRFMKDGSTYLWTKISDSDIEAALAEAQDAWDLADNKRRVFISQPVPPYDIGDMWVQGSNGDIKRCATAKTSSQTYSASDWVLASKYTDDSALTSWISGTYATDKTNLQNQIDGKAETWYQSLDPSTNWSAADKEKHTGDLWYKTSDDTTWYYNGTQWVQQNVPTAVFDKIDGKAQIFTSQPTTPYNVGDLWCVGSTGDILTCVTARATGNYTATDWEKRNKYTDDTAVNNLNTALTQQEIFNRLTNNGETQGIYLTNNKLYINASYIAAGVIADAAGKFSLNMTTGALTMNSGMFKGEINVNNNFLVNSSGSLTAKAGSFGALKIDSNDASIYAEGVLTLMNEYIYLSTSGTGKYFKYDLIIDTSFFSSGTYINLAYITTSGVNGDNIGSVSLYRYYADGSIGSKLQQVTIYAYSSYTLQLNEYMYANNGLYLLRFKLTCKNYYRALNFSVKTSATLKSLLFSGTDGIIAPSIKGAVRGSIQASDFSCGGWHFEGGNKSDFLYGELSTTEDYVRLSEYGLDFRFTEHTTINYRMRVTYDGIYRYEDSTQYYAQFYQGSDRRVKENIKDLDKTLSIEFINATEPKSFKYKDAVGKHYGMIAQDVRELLNDLGEEDAQIEHGINNPELEDMRTLEYVEYVPHLINYVKDLRAELNELKAELKELKEGK